jgi:2-dehydro-3-deoxyphosphooctonate aldolase (KDO 8-P synthase)
MLNHYLDITQNKDTFFLIAGPCVVENENLCLQVADSLVKITQRLGIPLIFKASYKKANRTNLNSFSGIGDIQALEILKKINQQFNIAVITDIHECREAELAAEYVDFIQIPAFLSRQTELLLAAGKTGKPVNIKKGQFMSPDQMRFAVEKVLSTGNESVMLTERGTSFGYQDLVVDFRSFSQLSKIGYPVVFDGTHSLQRPNSEKGVSGGQPEFIPVLCKAAIAAGADGLFLETHPNPEQALSDGANMLPLNKMEGLLASCLRIKKAL